MIFHHTLNNELIEFEDYIKRHSGDELVVYKNAQEEELNLSFYYPDDYDCQCKYPVFVFIHGGGWTSRKIFTDQQGWCGDYLGFLARYYSQKGYVSVSIDYRMIRDVGKKDEVGLIDLYEDCVDAVKYLQSHAEQYGLDFEHAILLGESAGGYLAAALVTLPFGKKSFFQKVILVNAITELFDSRWNAYVSEDGNHKLFKGKSKNEITQMLSPVYNISSSTPKTLLIHGTADTLVRSSHSYRFYDEMQVYHRDAELHLIEDTSHAFLLVEYMLEQKKSIAAASVAVNIIDEFIGA